MLNQHNITRRSIPNTPIHKQKKCSFFLGGGGLKCVCLFFANLIEYINCTCETLSIALNLNSERETFQYTQVGWLTKNREFFPLLCIQVHIMCHHNATGDPGPYLHVTIYTIKSSLPAFPWEMDAGVLKNVIFLFPEIFDLVRQSLNDGSLLLDFTVSLLKESYQCTLGQVPVPLCDVTHIPTYRQGTRLGNLVLATKILTAMLKSSCTFLTEVKSKRAPVKQDKIDDTIPGWLYTLPKHRTYRQIFSTSAFCDKIPEFRFLSYKCYTFTFSEFIFRCPEVDTWWRHVVSEMGVDHRFSYFNEIKS